MIKIRSTYRLLALVTALAFFAGVILPPGLQAHGLTFDFCPMKAGTEMPVTDGEHCNMAMQTGKSDTHQEAESTGCDMDFACACGVRDTSVKPEAIPVITKLQVTLSSSDIMFAKERKAPNTFTRGSPDLSSSPRPIFLLVSSFLN